jgi:exopolysaccharide biosynthesis polyprenyl glycosylphosphotransferase
MNNVDAIAQRLGVARAPSAPAPPSVVSPSYSDRDFALRRMLGLADVLGLWLALLGAMVIAGDRGSPVLDSLWLAPILPAWVFLLRAYGLYQRPIRRFEPTHLDDVSSLVHALLIGAVGLWLYYRLVPARKLDAEEMIVFGLLVLPLIASLRVGMRIVNLRLQGPERVFALASLEDLMVLKRKIGNHPEYEMALVGATSWDVDAGEELNLPLSADLAGVDSLIASGEIDHLIVRLDANFLPQKRVRELMHQCHRHGIRFGYFPGERTLLLPGTEINHIEGVGILTSNPPVFSRASSIMKRGLDITVSSISLTLLAPLMAAAAVAIKLSDGGPVLFRQTRVGKGGRRFQLIKFRTMVVDADRQVDELMAHSSDPDWLIMERDPRVTRVGRFLRTTSIDELPQLWNVLKGEMSMVGPRPLSEHDDERVEGWERHRLDLIPGVTGYWQVLGRNSIPFREMVEIDYAYVTNWSFLHDIKLLARTVPVVLTRRGAN